MYAVIEVGAKQYTVKKDDILLVEKQDIAEGEELVIDKVLLACKDESIEIGQPYLKQVKVQAVVLKQTKATKVVSYKYRRRKSSDWKKGHRQQLTMLKIKEIKIS